MRQIANNVYIPVLKDRSGRRGKRSQHDDQWEQYESVFDPSKRLYFDEEARRRIESRGYGVFSEKR